MLQQGLLAIAVASGFILGPLLGRWTKEEGKKIRESKIAKSLVQYSWLIAVILGARLGTAWYTGDEAFASIFLFAFIFMLHFIWLF